jgi:hypothetical protein
LKGQQRMQTLKLQSSSSNARVESQDMWRTTATSRDTSSVGSDRDELNASFLAESAKQPHAKYLFGCSSPRCGARTRSGGYCQSPAVQGKHRCRMHGGAAGSGAPLGNKNAFKHGVYTQGVDRAPSPNWSKETNKLAAEVSKTRYGSARQSIRSVPLSTRLPSPARTPQV